MATVKTVTLTGDLSSLLVGVDLERRLVRARLESNAVIDGKPVPIIDTNDSGALHFGTAPITLAADGTFSLPGIIASDATGINITDGSLRYRVVVEVDDRATGRALPAWDSGWLNLTATADLKDVAGSSVEVPPVWSDAFRDEMEGLRDEAEAARDQAAEIAGLDDVEGAMDLALPAKIADPDDPVGAALSAQIGDKVAGDLTTPGSAIQAAADSLWVRKTAIPHLFVYTDLPTSGVRSAHRGSGAVRQVAPEGSFAAFDQAIELGYHILDADTQVTKDGVPVLMHDATTGRTCDADVVVADTLYHQLPMIDHSAYAPGFAKERVPTIEQFIARYRGMALFTFEAKTLSAVPAIGAVINKYGIPLSAYLNTSVLNGDIMAAITAGGWLLHAYGATTTAHVDAAAAAGAKLIELPYNATSALVSYARASGIHRVISGPVSKRAQVASLDANFQGYVSDSPGYLDRFTGAARLTSSLARSIANGRLDPGTIVSRTSAITDWLRKGQGYVLNDGAANKWPNYQFGSLSGTPGASGSITLKFKHTTLSGTPWARVTARVLCPTEDGTGQDADTLGYVIGLREDGDIRLWSSNPAFGAATALGSYPDDPPLVVATEYTLLFEWTATQVRLTRVDTGGTTGWITNSDWRGPYHWAFTTSATAVTLLTEFAVA